MEKRKNYAYRVVMPNGQPRFMGTISADSMDAAVARIAKRDKLKIRRKVSAYWVEHEWTLDGVRVSVAVWAAPEYHTKDCEVYTDEPAVASNCGE